jgi:co-chaperonin GroES (HSP10)
MTVSYKPHRDLILCQLIQRKKIGSIDLPDDYQESNPRALVVDVGPGRIVILGDEMVREAMPCVVGDVVMIDASQGWHVHTDATGAYALLPASAILATVVGDEEHEAAMPPKAAEPALIDTDTTLDVKTQLRALKRAGRRH